VKNQTAGVREKVAQALAYIGKDSVPGLLIALKDSDEEVRMTALDALGRIGPRDPEVLPALLGALKDPGERIRLTAVTSLSRLDPKAARWSPRCTARFRTSEHVRNGAMEGLGKMGSAAVPLLAQALRGKE